MGNRGQKRADAIDELPADKRTCSSLEFRASSSVSPMETTASTSTNQTHDHEMETSSSASGSGSARTDEDKDSAYGSCDSDEMGDTEHRRNRNAMLEYQRQRLSDDQVKFKRVLSVLSGETEEPAQENALRELCEILSFCTDSSLSSLMANSLSPVLIKLAGHESNPEIMLLSIRALTYLCDTHSRSSSFIVRYNGIPVLCQRLLAIEYVDVAEQCLQALQKISREQPLACLQSGAIMAVLTYIDFFSTSIQRVALSTVVNICEKLPSEGFSPFMDAVPILCQLLQYEDNKLVEHVATCLIKIAERVHQSPEMLDELSKHGLIHQVAHLIDLNSKTTLSHSVDTGLIGLLVKLASGSMIAVRTLFDLNISSILKDILSTYDLSHGVPSPRAVGQNDQAHEVLKLLIQLLPVVDRNHEIPLAEEKATFLENNPNFLQKFGNDLLHVLIQVVDSGVDLYICYGCLCVIDKLIYYINADTLLDLLKQANISRFLAGVFTRKDRHVIMLALTISDTILRKSNDAFVDPFVKEGVLFAIDALIVPEKGSNFMFTMFNDIQLSNESSRKQCLCYSFDNCKSSSASESLNCKMDNDSLQTLAKNIRTDYFNKNASTSANGTTDILEKLKSLSTGLASMITHSIPEEGYDHVLHQIMSHLNGPDIISTFEFVESGITDALFNYLSSGECSRRISDGNGSNSQDCVAERRLKTFARLFWSNFSLSEFISKLQSGLSSVEDFPVVVNNVSKHRNSYATVPYRHCTTYPCMKVLFGKEDGELTLVDYSSDVQSVDPLSDFDAIEKFLWPKVCLESNKDDENGSVTSPNNVEPTSGESSRRNEFASDSMDHDQNATEKDSSMSTEHPQSSQNDGHLSFFLEGKLIDRRSTLYQAVIRHHNAQYDTVTHAALWNQTHKVTYKKASKSEEVSSQYFRCHARWSSALKKPLFSEIGSAVEKSTPCYNILFLLRILEAVNRFRYHITAHEKIHAFAHGRISDFDGVRVTGEGVLGISNNEFVNSRLTEKLEQQMRDPLAISTGGMPSWCSQLMASCAFLFSFEARCKYFRLTAFGKPQSQTRVSSGSSSTIQNDSTMPRKKFLVYRHQILESATKMMDLHAGQKVVLEVKYDEEVGTGLGPTLEFFTLVSNEFQKTGLGMWRGDSFLDSGLVGSPFGLFPGPWAPTVSVSNDIEFSEVKRKFLLLGQIVAKALHDGRVLDLPFSKAFYKLILGQELNLYDIQLFDPVLGKTLIEFQALIERRKYLESVGKISADDLNLCFHDTKINDLHLDFTLPGYPDYILASGPDKEMVNSANLEEYIELVVDATINSGISRQMDAFRSGFNQVFPIDNLQIFTDKELERLLCGESETWNSTQLSDLIKFDHGYTASSPPILHFLEIIQEFDYEQQKAFVKFVTGSPRLPLGGLASLNPKLTIVRKHCDKVVDADLPSVMTCANYLKLPPYSSKETMKEKLLYAITEGQGSFHLS
ncbi:putative HECT domain, armadillo-like helical, HECT, E3 ligase catalytic domain-containing protein [Helianthus annuus]|nr:putative HECT domain, armadillo-like helical, HECT, E3 ligase catalytic domain-containing protein [Helianthus annuus]KAJ0511545.1 putative HECT domain, armadillo-like helical, HECT, E3 ligase catalytic domain-containing protein [Helianthus annuus]KAJ0687214.1 putative HECT domain, armadillo-like helical, HECT, E3 ligase catalytic domain-containing protein [Helianthus annuus]KAJ0691014.1 putative HECT domain, armadillo-like helical, HECT, E3 ligase catalytic domain-containing protein [Helianth